MNKGMLRALVMTMLLMIGTTAFARSQPPELAALQFYRWYLHSLASEHDPLLDSPVQMSEYVDQAW